MRVEAILREAWRNVSSGTVRAVALSLVLTALGLTAVAAEFSFVSGVEREAQEFRDSGGSIITVLAPGRVDGARCDGLASVRGVRAAGALAVLHDERITAVALPGAPLAHGRASAGFPAVLRAETDGGPGLILSGDAERLLDATVGDGLRTTDGTTRVSGVYEYPRDGRRDGYGYMALETDGSSTAFDECWVDVWPQDAAMRSLILTTLRPGTGTDDEQPEVAPLNLTHGLGFEGYTRYRDRITRWAGVGIGVLTAIISFVALRARRVEIASALHDRASRIDLWAVTFTETLVWAAPPVVFCTVVSATVFAARGELVVGVVLGARVAMLIAAGAVLGVATALLATRERDLFLYAKDR
ncbi:hypothetical protein Cch01nite_15530 [Cellulomonas chitinilytica]|uniref:Uncharacterized protein n=1 Tax=Cellulomonas chitinilytica TaxID=398759 RepID=A0A919U269_9CELL|nr:hypothetical protein [Cellulomonas chitinilytica]GIG20829.1 hypothetical protein Cch01nite_15530 [Cellulomonas chitinilytica]